MKVTHEQLVSALRGVYVQIAPDATESSSDVGELADVLLTSANVYLDEEARQKLAEEPNAWHVCYDVVAEFEGPECEHEWTEYDEDSDVCTSCGATR